MKKKMTFSLVGLAVLVAIGILILPIIRASRVKQQLIGEWRKDAYMAKFEDNGEVWIEERRQDFLIGKLARYSIGSSNITIEDKQTSTLMGTAQLNADGNLYLDVELKNSLNAPGLSREVSTEIKTNLQRAK